MSEVVAAFGFGEQFEEAAAEVPEFLGGPLRPVAEQLLELAEGQLNRVEIGRIGWQVSDCGAHGLDGRDDSWRLVAGKVVHHHHVPLPE